MKGVDYFVGFVAEAGLGERDLFAEVVVEDGAHGVSFAVGQKAVLEVAHSLREFCVFCG